MLAIMTLQSFTFGEPELDAFSKLESLQSLTDFRALRVLAVSVRGCKGAGAQFAMTRRIAMMKEIELNMLMSQDVMINNEKGIAWNDLMNCRIEICAAFYTFFLQSIFGLYRSIKARFDFYTVV
jgi:hypothetical protein